MDKPAAAAPVASATSAEETGERPLAYVETIRELRPIPGADVIEVRTPLLGRFTARAATFSCCSRSSEQSAR